MTTVWLDRPDTNGEIIDTGNKAAVEQPTR
jgi:hypothetical protein